MMGKSPSSINMDAFKAAFHESSEGAERMEEEKKRADQEAERLKNKKKGKKGFKIGEISLRSFKEGVR